MMWINAAGGDWDIAGNWANTSNASDHHVPAASDDAAISMSGITVTHTTSASDSVHSLTSQAKITVAGGSLSLGTTSTINTDLSVSSGGSLIISNATLNGPGTLTNAGSLSLTAATINAPLVNQGTITDQGSVSTISNSFNNAAGATLRLQGNGSFGNATLNATAGLSNAGTIDLTSANANYSETLTVTGGTLVNTSGATLSTTAGTGGNRTITAQFDNQAGAMLLVNQPATLNSTGASTNEGTITVASGQPFTISGGTFNPSTGALSGAAFLSGVTLSSWTLPATASVTLANGSEPAGATLVNQGTLLVEGSNTFSGSFSNAAGATLRLQGNGSFGNATLNATAGLSNAGTIDLTSANANYSETLTVTGGTLVNASGATLSTSAGTGRNRTISAHFDNQAGATLLVNQPATLRRPAALTLPAAQPLSV
jgi:hypothetical protein